MNKEQFLWASSRRYNAYSNYCIRKFGEKLQKIPLDAGFTCPNRDGTKGTGGCSYCNNEAFTPYYCHASKSIKDQMKEGIAFHQKTARKPKKYIAYFQAYTNTYGSAETLKKMIAEAVSIPDVVGISIATRSDCMDEEKFDILSSLTKSHDITLEIGIESCYDTTLKRINRGHDFESVIKVCREASDRSIHTCGHLIFGLPGESREMMLSEAQILSGIPIDSLKFHQLQILSNTKIAEEYQHNPNDFLLFSAEDYCDFIVDFLEKLDPRIIIERLCGEVPPGYLQISQWKNIKAHQITSMIEKRLEERATWQGRFHTTISI